MTRDTEIEKLFSTAKTEFADNEEFTLALSLKLEKVEYIKRMQEENIRHYKKGIITAFIIGAIFGVLAIIAIAYMPTDTEILSRCKALDINRLKWISTAIISVFVGGSAIGIASSVQDLSNLKSSMAKR